MAVPRLRLTEDEYQLVQGYRNRHSALANECDTVGIGLTDVNHYWYKGENFSIHVRGAQDQQKLEDAFKRISEKHGKAKIKVPGTDKRKYDRAIKATLSDMHVGLDPNPVGNALFQYEYNEEIFAANLDKVYNSIIKEYNTYGKFDLLILDDLGDGLDGWNGETTRGGHKLEQNLTNVQAFEAYVTRKLLLIERLVQAGIANKIKIRTVTNCNHSGDFGHIANLAVQMLLERTYEKADVDYYILTRFMEHFEYGDHTFILTHGKDSKHMKTGLPLILNDKTVKFITDYIEHYDIRSKYVHVSKGDLHQVGYQKTKRFDYRNYMSFAPPTNWVQLNFGDTYSGYSVDVVPKYGNEIAHTDYFFELKKKGK